MNFGVGVSYKEDPEIIRNLLLDVAKENPGVLETPEPHVRFDEFGDSSLRFQILVWTSEYIDKPKDLKSELYFAIFKKFKEHNIEIPFPQRDIHIRGGVAGDLTNIT